MCSCRPTRCACVFFTNVCDGHSMRRCSSSFTVFFFCFILRAYGCSPCLAICLGTPFYCGSVGSRSTISLPSSDGIFLSSIKHSVEVYSVPASTSSLVTSKRTSCPEMPLFSEPSPTKSADQVALLKLQYLVRRFCLLFFIAAQTSL